MNTENIWQLNNRTNSSIVCFIWLQWVLSTTRWLGGLISCYIDKFKKNSGIR